MVLESLSNAYDAEMHPGRIYLHGAAYAAVGLLLALWTFPQYASIVMIFFTSIAAIPLIYALIKYEEDKDYHEEDERILIKEHAKAIRVYFMLFLGITTTLALAFILLPENQLMNTFEAQISTYQSINPSAQVTGAATSADYFAKIFLNNMRVLVLCVLFSFAYGAGAIFILTWNASVIALAIGDTLRTKAAAAASAGGLAGVAGYLGVSAQTLLLRYGIHGSIEILAYMTAGLAGGIISVAAIRHHFKTKKFEHIVMDSADLLIIAISLLLLGAAWEAWITPIFYL